MAIGRTNAGGSGSAGLNFKVICNPQPSAAKENTIWIDTDRINNYYFAANQPENMADYDVWISTGTSSAVAFSATKKNPIMVYPLFAKQMVSGALVDRDAKSWQGGEWVDWWNGELFDNGNQFTYITGSWTGSGYTHTSQTFAAGTIADGNIVLNGSTAKLVGLGTNKAVKVSGYSKLRWSGEVVGSILSGGKYLSAAIFISTSKADFTGKRVANQSLNKQSGAFDLTLDIPTGVETAYIVVRSEVDTACKTKIKAIRLE